MLSPNTKDRRPRDQLPVLSMKYATPSSLATAVRAKLQASGERPPAIRTLENLFEIMFAASIHTEEGEPVTFHLAYVDPALPGPDPPPRIRRYRWRPWRFDAPIPFDVPSLVKNPCK
jgi:hypothetical protein